jgi:hypothetical protein
MNNKAGWPLPSRQNKARWSRLRRRKELQSHMLGMHNQEIMLTVAECRPQTKIFHALDQQTRYLS